MDARYGVPAVLRTGVPEFYADVPDALLVAAARDRRHLEILRQLCFTSVILVPLRTRDRTLGVLMLISAESGRRYDAEDLALAEELARRAAVAGDNAELFRGAQEAVRRRDETVEELRLADRRKDAVLAMLAHAPRHPLSALAHA